MVVPVEIALLAAWLGAALLMSASVAPAAFAVLPSRTLAGAIVGRVLPVVFYAGILIGVAVAVLEGTAHGFMGARALLAALVAVACAIAQLVIGPRIERVRAGIQGPVEALAMNDPQRVAFGRLHMFSVAWLGLAMLAAFACLVLLVRASASQR